MPSGDAQTSAAQASSADAKALPAESERVAVPGFDGATAWLNVDHALTMKELAGHVVVVDFWTSCCINCLQTLPTLAKIEDQFANDPVVVVGVHSPKFDAETERARLSDAVRQYSIKHPVAVDGSMKVWNAWGVDAWPTVIVLDTKGRAVWVGSGEPDRDALASIISSALAEGKSNGTLNGTKIAGITPEKDDSGPLKFPGKVTPLVGGGLAVSDTGHNRIVLLDAAGKVSAVIGSGLSGNTDRRFCRRELSQTARRCAIGQCSVRRGHRKSRDPIDRSRLEKSDDRGWHRRARKRIFAWLCRREKNAAAIAVGRARGG